MLQCCFLSFLRAKFELGNFLCTIIRIYVKNLSFGLYINCVPLYVSTFVCKETIFRLYTLCVWCAIIGTYVCLSHVRRLSLDCIHCVYGVPLYVSMYT